MVLRGRQGGAMPHSGRGRKPCHGTPPGSAIPYRPAPSRYGPATTPIRTLPTARAPSAHPGPSSFLLAKGPLVQDTVSFCLAYDGSVHVDVKQGDPALPGH